MSGSDPADRKPSPRRDAKTTRTYLKTVLKLNPLADADRMVSLRQQFVGQVADASGSMATYIAPEKRERVREEIQQKLDDIRRGFWKTPAKTLQKEIQSLPVDDFPNLQAAARRLNSVLEVRESIDVLREDGDFHLNLFNMIRRLMTLGPVQAGELKGTYLFDLTRSEQLRPARRMAKAIRDHHPEVYQLEAAWFDQIIKTKRRKASSSVSESGEDDGGGNYGCLIMFAVYVVIKILVLLARASGN